MKLNKNHIAVAKFASASTVRAELSSVLIKNGRVVATDSFRLVELAIEDAEGAEPVLVDAKAFGKLRGKELEAETGIPGAGLTIEADGVKTILQSIDASRFPDYEQVLPTSEPTASVRINGRYLAEVAALIAKTEKNETVLIDFYGQQKPVIISTSKGRGIVMPVLR